MQLQFREEFNSWLKFFAHWLRSSPLGKTDAPRPRALQEYERWLPSEKEQEGKRTLDCRLSLLREDDPRIPPRLGGIATWRLINHQAPNGAVLITLDNLFKLSKELPAGGSLTPVIRRGLERSLGLTHRFQVVWLFRSASHKQLRFILIDSFDIDLSCQFVDEAPKDVVKHLAIEVFSMRIIPTLDWKERIYNFPWYELIREFSPRKGCPTEPRYRRLCKRIQNVTIR